MSEINHRFAKATRPSIVFEMRLTEKQVFALIAIKVCKEMDEPKGAFIHERSACILADRGYVVRNYQSKQKDKGYWGMMASDWDLTPVGEATVTLLRAANVAAVVEFEQALQR